jgi:hypothetical protein
MTLADITGAIEKAWSARSPKMDWLGLETVLVAILTNPTADDARKVTLSKEAIDAYTKRGHFA